MTYSTAPVSRAGIQGELGSFSEEAAVALLGAAADVVPMRENRDVTRALAAGELDLGLLPIENSLAGSVMATYDAILAESGVCAVGQTVLPIHHCVVGAPGSTLADVRIVESHPVALAQCRALFAAHPEIEARASFDTAGAAREIAQARDPRRAAIASARAADRYGLALLARNVEDRDDNVTRFLLLSTTPARVGAGRRARTMVVYATRNEPGALLHTLEPLARRGMNMVKLESRPAGTPWSYRFIVEFEHDDAGAARAALAELAPHTVELRHVGTFALEARG